MPAVETRVVGVNTLANALAGTNRAEVTDRSPWESKRHV
jgi:hypothetical protein